MQPDCKDRPGSLRRALVALLVAACVLAGQAGVATHALGHALEDLAASASASAPAADGGAVPDGCDERKGDRRTCPLHALYTELASMAVGAWPAFVALAGVPESACCNPVPAFPAPLVAFRSRAPPPLPA